MGVSLMVHPQAEHPLGFGMKVLYPHGAEAVLGTVDLDAAWLHVALQPGLSLSLSQ